MRQNGSKRRKRCLSVMFVEFDLVADLEARVREIAIVFNRRRKHVDGRSEQSELFRYGYERSKLPAGNVGRSSLRSGGLFCFGPSPRKHAQENRLQYSANEDQNTFGVSNVAGFAAFFPVAFGNRSKSCRLYY